MVCQVAELLVPLQQCKVGLFLRVAKLGVLAGGALGADGLEVDGGKDGVTGFDAARRPFLQQRIGGLAASRTVEDVNVQTRHGDPPVDGRIICLSPVRGGASQPVSPLCARLVGCASPGREPRPNPIAPLCGWIAAARSTALREELVLTKTL